MRQSVRAAIYQAIIGNHWLEVKYRNSKEEETTFYTGINDIDVFEDKLYCDIFNCFKNNECIDNPFPITISNIIFARVLEQSFYPIPKLLLSRIDYDKELVEFLDVNSLDNDILRYLSECYSLDNDPYVKDKVVVEGIDCNELLREKKYKIDDKQFATILNNLFKNDVYEGEKIYRYSKELAINVFSIDIQGKQYVVAYHSLNLNFKDKTLKIGEKCKINKSFILCEGKKATLSQYLDISPDEFCRGFAENPREYIDLIRDNFRQNEKVDTTPRVFVIERRIQAGVDRTFEEIYKLQKETNGLTFPLKAFFGRNRNVAGSSKETNVVVFDKSKINIDQMRVVYNSMINHITYVKGPPGTGKTETIFNVLLSAYYNDKKVLVCSNNNHPVNDIVKKMQSSLNLYTAKNGETKEFVFPIIRLGNNDELRNALHFLIEAYNFAVDNRKTFVNNESTELIKEKSLSEFHKLRQLLKEYEERIDLEEKIEKLNKLKELTTSEKISDEINNQIDIQSKKLNNIGVIKDEDVAKYTVSANENKSFQHYVYYSSMARFKKLLSPTYKDLVDILKMGVCDEAVNELNKYFKDDANVRRFTDIFPIVVTTNISADKLGSPIQHFDMCIMDEAGQCNAAISLIPIIRAKNLLLVGDTNQLQPVTVIETDVNERLMEKYNIKKEYNYVKNSILSTMLSKDNNSKSILLRFHYRCGQKIAQFVNSRFYEQQLKLLNNSQGNLIYINVNNSKIPDLRNAYREEAAQIARIIRNNNYKDVGIVTPFVNQASLINEYLQKEGFSLDDVKAGTIHTLQGSERSVIIMSSALSLKTSKKTMDWIKNNHELINVAVTRAKNTFIFAGDKEAIDMLSKNETNDIKSLSDYVMSNGIVEVIPSGVRISTDFSNDSEGEKAFFETITPYFTKRGSKMRIERNVPVKTAIRSIDDEDYELIGQKEFDVVVQATNGGFLVKNVYRTILVFEIDGGEHIGSRTTSKRDRVKEEICKRYGIKLIRIANSDVKDYQLIISLFESIIKGIPDIDNINEQLSLFESE